MTRLPARSARRVASARSAPLENFGTFHRPKTKSVIRFCVPNHLSSFGRYAPLVPLWALRASRPALGATRLSSRFGRYAPLLVTWGATRLSSLKLKRKRLSQGAAQTLPSHPSASSHPSSSAAHPSRTAPLHLHIPQHGTHITVRAYAST